MPQRRGRGSRSARAARKNRTASACGGRVLALRNGRRADALVSMVCRREQAGRERKIARGRGDRGGRERRDYIPPEVLGEHVFLVDAESPGLVHLAPAMVGPSDSRVLVRSLQRADRRRGTAGGVR